MALSDARCILLTSFKRDGAGVGTPVWIAPLGDGTSGFTTPAGSWKVKRIRRNPRVTAQPSDRRGRPLPHTEAVELHATVHDDAATVARVRDAVASKYGWEYRLIGVVEHIIRVARRRPVERVVIVLASSAGDPSSPAF